MTSKQKIPLKSTKLILSVSPQLWPNRYMSIGKAVCANAPENDYNASSYIKEMIPQRPRNTLSAAFDDIQSKKPKESSKFDSAF